MKNSEFSLTAKNDTPEPEMQVFDYCQPALVSGKYEISTKQTITWTEQGVAQEYAKTQSFLVEGPRFSIDGSLVYGLFPAAGATGDFESVLPNIALTRKTLPWERTIDDRPPTDPPVPWVALMVFNEDEITGTFNTTFGNVVNPGAGILGPQNLSAVTESEKQSPCLAVDVPAGVFSKVVPSLEDLRYLAHCREVDMAYKELRNDVVDGMFSVVIANRFPTPAKTNYACLVSLEGFSAYLYGNTIPASYTTVRMAVLASWSFTGLPAQDENFSQLMTNLNACSLRLPNLPPATGGEAEQLVASAFHDGYVALNYLTRFGEETAAWYRGPLTPVLLNDVPQEPYFSAEAAMIYDEVTGLFDLSYAVAWQIGRLLALSDKEFAVAVMNWRKGEKTETNVYLEQERAAERLKGIVKAERLSSSPDRQFITRQLHHFLVHDFAKKVAPADQKKHPLFRTGDFSGQMKKGHRRLPGMLSREEVLKVLKKGPRLEQSLRELLFHKNKNVR